MDTAMMVFPMVIYHCIIILIFNFQDVLVLDQVSVSYFFATDRGQRKLDRLVYIRVGPGAYPNDPPPG
jgi:hypothetical protein